MSRPLLHRPLSARAIREALEVCAVIQTNLERIDAGQVPLAAAEQCVASVHGRWPCTCDKRVCRRCGCTQSIGCQPPLPQCRWIEADLCSNCDPT